MATLLYDAWGNQRSASGATVPNYRYTGAELDPASGLYHMGARFYDSTIGRWLSEDQGGDNSPLSLNLYAYSWNSPTRFIDATGLDPITWLLRGISVHGAVEEYFLAKVFPGALKETEFTIAGFGLRLDMMARVGGVWEVYELKPNSYRTSRSKMTAARDQVRNYVRALKASGRNAQLGTSWQPQNESVPFNDVFHIELDYIEPGLIGYSLVPNENAEQVLINHYGVAPSLVAAVLAILAGAWSNPLLFPPAAP